tara:strand:+ start:708 stop:1088 length:381 start_codon:yes stop_codon:yes gene_type:complete
MARSDYKYKTVTDCITGKTERVALTEAEIDEYVAREEAWAAGAVDRAWAAIREERDRRLVATDFYALSDVTLADNMKTYRQELRDLPAAISASSGPWKNDPMAFKNAWDSHISDPDNEPDPWPTKP